jgi:hypothetical protein
VGLSEQRIYQDLVEENGFANSYESVKRFVRKLRVRHPQRVWRLDCQPGEELQLHFGLGAGNCERVKCHRGSESRTLDSASVSYQLPSFGTDARSPHLRSILVPKKNACSQGPWNRSNESFRSDKDF